ncbi:MAG: hypothetical protein ACFE9L_00060 [Candidatus Hodarchaeota archaeon]
MKSQSKFIYTALTVLLLFSGIFNNIMTSESISNSLLVSQWNFDEDSGDKVYDLTENSNTGILRNTQ